MQPQVPQNNLKPQPSIRAQLLRGLNAVRRRPFMKLSALVLAFFFWAVVIASDPSLVREKTFAAATVSVQNVESLRNRGYIVMQDLTSVPITVKMRVEVKQADFDRVTAASFAPKLDLTQQINSAGKQNIRFTASYENSGTVLSFEPEYLEVEVEPYITRRVPVVIEQSGQSDSPLWINSPTAEPSTITVGGPKSIVDQIRRAVAPLPMSSLSADRPQDHLTAVISLQDANNNEITSPLLRLTNESIPLDSVRIDVSVYPMQEIPVSVESAVTGVPAHGYMLGEVRITPQTVQVAASPETLAALDVLHVSTPIDVTGQSVNQVVTSPLRNVSGLVYIAADAVVVEADILPATHVHTYIDLPVTVKGLPPGLVAKLSQSTMSAVISGEYQDVEPLTAESIHLYVDAYDLSAGVHIVEVMYRVDGTDAYVCEPENPRITLTLTQSPSG